MSNKELKIKLSIDLMKKVNRGELRTSELISFVLDTVPGAATLKDINQTALKDISFNGQYAINARIDIYDGSLIMIFSKDDSEKEIIPALKPNTKFTDGIREYEIIEYMQQFKMYRVKNYTDNRENELKNEIEIQTYIDKKEYYEERLKKGKQRAIEYQIQEEKEKAETERKQKEYEFCYGFVDDKSKLQKGKVLKTLNKQMRYSGQWFTVKGFIEYLIKNHSDLTTKEYFNTNRYSKKKIDLCYKKLVDKMEYSAWWTENNKKVGVEFNTKTEYDYCNYLINNNIKLIA